MAQYRIVCTEQEPYGHSPSSARIVAVGVSDGAQIAAARWTVEQVIEAMDRGHVFYTRGEQSGKIALVEKYWCSRCVRYHIRSAADAVYDNNLDSLRFCAWGQSA